MHLISFLINSPINHTILSWCDPKDQRLEALVRLLDRALRRRVARLRLGRLVLARPRRRVRQLVFQLTQRRLGRLDLALRLLLG